MRLFWGLMPAVGLLVSLHVGSLMQSQAAHGAEAEVRSVAAKIQSGVPNRQQCATYARQRKDLEKAGIRQLVEMDPVDVLSQFGKPAARRVYAYIQLSEKVLFQCPPYVLNANVGPLNLRLDAEPPLPHKGPRRPKLRLKRTKMPVVPLPVRAPIGQSKRFEIPRSQG